MSYMVNILSKGYALFILRAKSHNIATFLFLFSNIRDICIFPPSCHLSLCMYKQHTTKTTKLSVQPQESWQMCAATEALSQSCYGRLCNVLQASSMCTCNKFSQPHSGFWQPCIYYVKISKIFCGWNLKIHFYVCLAYFTRHITFELPP